MATVHTLRSEHGREAFFATGDLFRMYWDACVDGLFAIQVTSDGDFRCAGFNAVIEAATGLKPEQTRGRRPVDYLDPRTAAAMTALYRECVAVAEPITRSMVLELPTGARIFDISLVPVRDGRGRIKLLLGRLEDITELELTAQASQSANGLLQDVLTALSTHLAVLDGEGRILMVNEAWRCFDRDLGGGRCVPGANYLELCVQIERENADAAPLLAGLESVRDGRARSFAQVYRFGSSMYQMRATRLDRGRDRWIVVAHDDVTAAYETRREVSALTERLLDIQEQERQRIAQELHDSTTQHLVAAQLGLALIRDGRASERTLADMRDSLTEAHREIRTLSYLLHPPQLAAERLQATLRQFAQGFQRRTGTEVQLSIEGDIDGMAFPVQRAVFRVVQEALANAHRHGRAEHVSITLSRRKAGLRLEIADDGCAPDAPIAPGLGLPGMEARIERFGGTLSVSPNGAGMTVLALVPAGALHGEDENASPAA